MAPTVYTGRVTVDSHGWWILQDDDPQAWEGEMPSNFAGVMGRDGVYFISGQWSGEVEVTVEVHQAPPPEPAGWSKSSELIAEFPSGSATAYGQTHAPTEDEIVDIVLPATRVVVRVLANGWTSPPEVWHSPDTWLLQIWPAD